MSTLKIESNDQIGKIKAMHGVGQPPLVGISTEYFRYLKEAAIPYSRLHDVGGLFGKNMWADIPNIFRDFDKDENDPDNYDFTWTDILIKGLIENGCKPYFRLGVTIENFHKLNITASHRPKIWKNGREFAQISSATTTKVGQTDFIIISNIGRSGTNPTTVI